MAPLTSDVRRGRQIHDLVSEFVWVRPASSTKRFYVRAEGEGGAMISWSACRRSASHIIPPPSPRAVVVGCPSCPSLPSRAMARDCDAPVTTPSCRPRHQASATWPRRGLASAGSTTTYGTATATGAPLLLPAPTHTHPLAHSSKGDSIGMQEGGPDLPLSHSSRRFSISLWLPLAVPLQ